MTTATPRRRGARSVLARLARLTDKALLAALDGTKPISAAVLKVAMARVKQLEESESNGVSPPPGGWTAYMERLDAEIKQIRVPPSDHDADESDATDPGVELTDDQAEARRDARIEQLRAQLAAIGQGEER